MATLMGQPKPQASLSSSLLARKGQARPAMRPQGFSGFGNLADAIDDLGWNDMEGAAPAPAEPPVLREREALKAEIETPRPSPAAPAETKPVEAKPVEAKPEMSNAALTRIGRNVRARQSKAKSAFTLRLDADRHLRLRLAAAVCDRSAQALVTEALDTLLATLPEVEALAQSLPAKKKFRGE
jgi:hypothetical protein